MNDGIQEYRKMAVFAVNSTVHAFRHEQTEYYTIVPTTYTIRI